MLNWSLVSQGTKHIILAKFLSILETIVNFVFERTHLHLSNQLLFYLGLFVKCV